MSILWGAVVHNIAKAMERQIRDHMNRSRFFKNTSVAGDQKLRSTKLTEEGKRKLQAKIVEQQGKAIKRAQAKGLEYLAAKLRVDGRYPREPKSQARGLSTEEKRFLQAKILEHGRQQFEKKRRL